MSDEVEQATAAPGEKRAISRADNVRSICARLRLLGVPEKAIAPIEAWADADA